MFVYHTFFHTHNLIRILHRDQLYVYTYIIKSQYKLFTVHACSRERLVHLAEELKTKKDTAVYNEPLVSVVGYRCKLQTEISKKLKIKN